MSGHFAGRLHDRWLPEDLEEKIRVQNRVGRLKTVSELTGSLVDAMKGCGLGEALAKVSPWLGAIGESAQETVPVVKFVAKTLEGVGRIDDSELLGHLACSVAYQRAFEKALPQVPELRDWEAEVTKDFDPRSSDATYEFQGFSLERALSHLFVRDADADLEHFLKYALNVDDETAIRRLVGRIHNRFAAELQSLITHRATRDKFDPFYRLLQLDTGFADAYTALEEHALHQRWLFEQVPVLDVEPFALRHIYQELDCGDLSWQGIGSQGQKPLDSFAVHHGGREPLLETVIRWMEDPDFDDALVIQGSAGSGKSTFSLRLCVKLEEMALRPIRIELKNLSTRRGVDVMEAFSEAVELCDDRRDPERNRRHDGELLHKRLFDDLVNLGSTERPVWVSRYVLILDGWDELATSASAGYQQELERILKSVRDEFLRNRPKGKVRVVLCGRPTPAVANTGFLKSKSRILTVRPLTADQLEEMVGRFRHAVENRPLPLEEEAPWSLSEADGVLSELVEKYRKEVQRVKEAQERGESTTHRLEVLGQPLLIHLTLRLIAEEPKTAGKLVEEPTALYRSMVDLVVSNAGKAEGDERRREDQSVIVGDDLRALLRDTAAAMQALGVRDISREELSLRLATTVEHLQSQVRRLGAEQILSRLMISFFFKSGHPDHGCAFSHKSFREYLFAEKVVERLKAYGREAPEELPPRVGEGDQYWQDFSEKDPRYQLFRDLCDLLGPQWMNAEERDHLLSLLEWELKRSFETDPFPQVGAQTEALEIDQWRRVRDGLADLWDAWGEGIHLRALPRAGRFGDVEQMLPYALETARLSTELAPSARKRQIPMRVISVDSHFGDGLFALAAWIHGRIYEVSKDMDPRSPRPYQSASEEQRHRFAPSGDGDYFQNYLARINGAGFRPSGLFPKGQVARCIDLSGAHLDGANLDGANLDGANLDGANLDGADLYGATLSRRQLKSSIGIPARLPDGTIPDSEKAYRDWLDAATEE